MKKIVCISISALLFIFIVFGVSADALKSDSLVFSDSVYESIDNANRNNTIQIYNGTFMHLFAERKSIEEIITDESMLEPYYAVKGVFSSPEYYYIKDGASQKISINPLAIDSTLRYVTSPDSVLNHISPFLTVQNVYYLNGDASHDGIYIYYKTSKGDYIYYKDYAEAEESYLFPLEDFYSLAETMTEKLQQEKQEREHLDSIHKYLFGGPTLLSDVVDISSYRVTPQNPVFLYIGIVVVILAVGTVLFVFIRKKRSRTAS